MSAEDLTFYIVLALAVMFFIAWQRSVAKCASGATAHKAAEDLKDAAHKAALDVRDAAHKAALEKKDGDHKVITDDLTRQLNTANRKCREALAMVQAEEGWPQPHYDAGRRRVLAFFQSRLCEDSTPEVRQAVKLLGAWLADLPDEMDAPPLPYHQPIEVLAYAAGLIEGRWNVETASNAPVWATLIQQLWRICRQQVRRDLLHDPRLLDGDDDDGDDDGGGGYGGLGDPSGGAAPGDEPDKNNDVPAIS